MDISKLSPEQTAIVMATITEGEFRASSVNERSKISKLHGYGLVRRHETDPMLCFATDDGRAAAVALGRIDPIAPRAVAVVDPSPEPQAVADTGAMGRHLAEARALLDDGDVIAARRLAALVYAQAKTGGGFSAKMKLKESLEACHRIQAGALSIEIGAKLILAEEWEKAGADGKTLKGRPKSVPDENAFTAEEAGLTRKELHEARKLLEAERKQPGIAERAIAARLAQGLEPTRAAIRHAIGTKTATKEERGNNLYETPPEGTWTILSLEQFSEIVEEPFCGRGAIVKVLEAAGYDVVPSDLVDRGVVTKDGECQGVADYMTTEGPSHDIVSNPPYGDEMNAVIAHALRVRRPRKMALLLNLNVLSGYEDADRTFYMETCPPARIYVNKHRLPMMHRDGWDGNKASSQMNTMWCVWEMDEDGSYGCQTVLYRVDYEADEVARFRAAHEAESEAA